MDERKDIIHCENTLQDTTSTSTLQHDPKNDHHSSRLVDNKKKMSVRMEKRLNRKEKNITNKRNSFQSSLLEERDNLRQRRMVYNLLARNKSQEWRENNPLPQMSNRHQSLVLVRSFLREESILKSEEVEYIKSSLSQRREKKDLKWTTPRSDKDNISQYKDEDETSIISQGTVRIEVSKEVPSISMDTRGDENKSVGEKKSFKEKDLKNLFPIFYTARKDLKENRALENFKKPTALELLNTMTEQTDCKLYPLVGNDNNKRKKSWLNLNDKEREQRMREITEEQRLADEKINK